ncbi:MAG: ABC transporter ATP-binding protein [Thermoanaerobaculia bacterium]|nr:ABC transporter ATP-binding protein [Thermoanaerobaculia bacterium]
MSDRWPIRISEVTKKYRLFGRRTQFQTLKSALLRRELVLPEEGTITALRDISFRVEQGEAFGVIGPNGSGKSTLLKLVSGILKPTEGEIDVRGRIAALIELGAGFHPEISGRENVYINGIMMGLTRREIDQRFDQIVEFAGIGEFLDQPVKTYSSGMYVRLGFAVAVHLDPDILLIDEVLSVGDEEFSQKCIARIQEMKLKGVTLLFVTHQLDLVRQLCDRALWLDHGRICGLGDPVRVVDSYLQRVSGGETADEEEVDEAGDEEEEEGSGEEERWGSGEVLIRRVSLFDSKGRELVALGGESHVEVEFAVEVREPQEDCVFGVGIFHADGTCVYGTNTDIEGWQTDRVDSYGTVRFTMPSLSLVAGNYRIDVAAHTRNGRAFDYRRGVVKFVVGSRVTDVGVYRPSHEWSFSGGIRMTDRGRRGEAPANIEETLKNLEED